MALGDYSQEVETADCHEGNYQFASSKNPSVWDRLFHRSFNKGFEDTGRILITLLEKLQEFTDEKTDEKLDRIANDFLEDCEKKSRFPWQYYYVKYEAFRPGKYGKMYNPNKEKNPYLFTVLLTKQRLSPSSYIPDLRYLEAACQTEGAGKHIEGKYIMYDSTVNKLQGHEYKSIDRCITCTNNTYEIRKKGMTLSTVHFTGDIVDTVTIAQAEDGIDMENRIEKLKSYLEEHDFFSQNTQT